MEFWTRGIIQASADIFFTTNPFKLSEVAGKNDMKTSIELIKVLLQSFQVVEHCLDYFCCFLLVIC